MVNAVPLVSVAEVAIVTKNKKTMYFSMVANGYVLPEIG